LASGTAVAAGAAGSSGTAPVASLTGGTVISSLTGGTVIPSLTGGTVIPSLTAGVSFITAVTAPGFRLLDFVSFLFGPTLHLFPPQHLTIATLRCFWMFFKWMIVLRLLNALLHTGAFFDAALLAIAFFTLTVCKV
jgi:hypothetical protein